MMAFVEISELIFDNKTEIVIDPAEEKIKSEFSGVKNTYIPMHAIIRIDEVEKTGTNKMHPLGKADSQNSSIAPFPVPGAPGKGKL